MQKKIILSLWIVAGLSLTASSAKIQKVNFEFNDGTETLSADRSKVAKITFTEDPYEEVINGHTFVYLGAVDADGKPTEKLWWATMNVGATTPQEYGNYYSWGETDIKESYSIPAYTYQDNPTTLPATADAATVNWGDESRMPTRSEWDALINLGNDAWVWSDGEQGTASTKAGYTVTSPTTKKSIFLPAAGYYSEATRNSCGTHGYYWSSTYNSESIACYMYFLSSTHCVNTNYRFMGQSVRAVTEIE